MSRLNTQGDLFSPMLFPNEAVPASVVTKLMMASYKLDGMRCIFKDGEMLSRSFKPYNNKQLRERFAPMMELSKVTGLIYDGEIYSHELNFQELMHCCRSDDLGEEELPESIHFYCFDALDMNHQDMPASLRHGLAEEEITKSNPAFVNVLKQTLVSTPEEVEAMFAEATEEGFEGLILKNPNSVYKFGRVTTKSGDGYKFKPYRTYDAKIIGVEQSTKVDPNAVRKVTELGYHKTSQKKGDRILIEKASAFIVDFEGKEMKVSLAMPDNETAFEKDYSGPRDTKESVWENRDNLVGKYIEFKGMEVGAKDVPRHPVFLRFRNDKDE